MAGIVALLRDRGLPKRGTVKIARHKDKRADLEALLAQGHFEAGYQAYQAGPVFNCDYVVSCMGMPGLKARFIGVYQVMGQRRAEDVPLPPHLAYLETVFPGGYAGQGQIWYELVKLPGFEDLENRVVLDWGSAALSWAQWATPDKDKRIIQMPVPAAHLAEEILEGTTFFEGSVIRVLVNRYERDPKAREACIAHYGPKCDLCGFLFGAFYGDVARDFVHVHHLRPLSSVGGTYEIDPIADLRPVCPNCHAVLHRTDPPLSLGEVRALIKSHGRWPDKSSSTELNG